jgi:HlyD family secretion protein
VHVQVGDQVGAGELIATLDDTYAQDQLAQARLSLQLAELALDDLTREPEPAEVAAASAAVESAQANLDALLAGPTAYDLQAAKLNVDAARNQLWSAQAQRDALKGNPLAGRADIDSLEAQVLVAEVNVQQAVLAQERLSDPPGEADVALARSQVAQAQAALDALLSRASANDVARAEISVAQARLSLESAQRGVEDVELKAPASGTVTAVLAGPGALVGAGTPIVTLLDVSEREFHTTNLSERDVAQIHPGQTAVVTLKAYPNKPLQATVARVGLEPGQFVGDAATFPVVLSLGESDMQLRPGMTGRAEIRGRE